MCFGYTREKINRTSIIRLDVVLSRYGYTRANFNGH